ncbi:MAG: hypothetical protein HFJ66_08065 [Eggerthellaceae bacterium]|nr:hypothetical protein [Eggerthellaceae bacterium]
MDRMDRWILRICSFAMCIVMGVCAIAAARGYQQIYPYDANVLFSISTTDSSRTKDELAHGLSALGNEFKTIIGKVSANPKDYRNERDIVVFSGEPEPTAGPITVNGSVHWLDPHMSGKVISHDDLGDRSLDGQFFAIGTHDFIDALSEWGESNSVEICLEKVSDGSESLVIRNFLQTSTGMLAIVCFFLVIASVLALMRRLYRKQKVELIEGIPYWKVRARCCLEILFLTAQGCMPGCLAIALYLLALPQGIMQLGLVASLCSQAMLLYCSIAFAIVGAIALFCVPSFKDLGQRSVTARQTKTLSLGLEIAGIALVVISSISTAGMLNAETRILENARIYEEMPEATRVRLLYTPDEATIDNAPETHELISNASESGSLLLSLDVGQSMLITEDELRGFDGFVVVNRSFLNEIHVGVEEPGGSGAIFKINQDQVPAPLWDQTQVWLSNNTKTDPTFYRYEGEGLLALGANVSQGGTATLMKNPLVLLADNISEDWSYSGFIVPLLTTGNLFFSSYESAQNLIEESGMSGYIAAIDNIVELSLQQAQAAYMKAVVLLVSVLTALALVVVMGAQDAASWCSAKSKLIFARRSSGSTLPSISTAKLGRRIAFLCVGALAGAVFCLLIGSCDMTTVLLVVFGVTCLTMLCTVVFRCHFADIEFNRLANRR